MSAVSFKASATLPQLCMGAVSTPRQLDALVDALEPRGVLEHGLQGSLERVPS